jgi:2-polyprenyl-3-methyl-5-hydroxy-6-metoxy-1,4-benzoquinol methylase
MGEEKGRNFYVGDEPDARKVIKYHHLYGKVAELLPLPGMCPSILDLGCGPGLFADFLAHKGYKSYLGIDFSAPLIDRAMINAPHFNFLYADLRKLDTRPIFKQYKLVTAMEFLEHINNDLNILKALVSGTKVILSVPNYQSACHVRCFSSIDDASKRYSAVLNLDEKISLDGQINQGFQNKIFILGGVKK